MKEIKIVTIIYPYKETFIGCSYAEFNQIRKLRLPHWREKEVGIHYLPQCTKKCITEGLIRKENACGAQFRMINKKLYFLLESVANDDKDKLESWLVFFAKSKIEEARKESIKPKIKTEPTKQKTDEEIKFH